MRLARCSDGSTLEDTSGATFGNLKMINPRIAISALTLSAAGLVSIALSEGYEPVAKPPIAGDSPTNGFGQKDGVKLGEKTTPVRALVQLLASSNKYEIGIKRCVKVPLYQYEFDAILSASYNLGTANVCGSGFVKRFNAGDYEGGCKGMATHPDGSPAWSNFQGRYLQSLQDRRIRERDFCLGKATNL